MLRQFKKPNVYCYGLFLVMFTNYLPNIRAVIFDDFYGKTGNLHIVLTNAATLWCIFNPYSGRDNMQQSVIAHILFQNKFINAGLFKSNILFYRLAV